MLAWLELEGNSAAGAADEQGEFSDALTTIQSDTAFFSGSGLAMARKTSPAQADLEDIAKDLGALPIGASSCFCVFRE